MAAKKVSHNVSGIWNESSKSNVTCELAELMARSLADERCALQPQVMSRLERLHADRR
jgi:hypothetical protein